MRVAVLNCDSTRSMITLPVWMDAQGAKTPSLAQTVYFGDVQNLWIRGRAGGSPEGPRGGGAQAWFPSGGEGMAPHLEARPGAPGALPGGYPCTDSCGNRQRQPE